VALQHFEAGWGWDSQIRQLAKKKYRQDLLGLLEVDPLRLARLLRGEILAEQPYASVLWVLRLRPFRPLELYWLLNHDPEFGVDLRVFYARKSLTVPTEDAYVFAWDYLALLARYGRGSLRLDEAEPGPEWLAYQDFAGAAGSPLEWVSVGVRNELLRLLTLEVIEVALRRLECGVAAAWAGGWEVVWPVLGDLALRLRYGQEGLEVAFDSHGAKKYSPDFLMSFNWLYINALLRECRQVDASLPRLSRYF
jgi:hypothetical protein